MSHNSASKRGFKARVIGLLTSLAMAMSLSVAIAPAAHAVDSVGVDVNPTSLEFGTVDFGRRNLWPWVGAPWVSGGTGLTDGSSLVGPQDNNYNFKAHWTGIDVPTSGCLTDLRLKMTGAPRAAGWPMYFFNAAFDSISGEQASVRTSGEAVPGQDGPPANRSGAIIQYRAALPGFGFSSWGASVWPPIMPDTQEFYTFEFPLSTANFTAADLAAGNFYVIINSFGGSAGVADELSALTLSYTVTAEPCPSPLPARITSVSPAEGPLNGGTAITINGSGFEDGSSVTIDNAECTNVVVVSSTQITCTAPSGTAGAANIAITSESFNYVNATNGYWYNSAPPPTDIAVVVDDKEITVGDEFPTWTTDQDENISELSCNVYLSTDTGYLDALEESELTANGSPYVIHCTGLEGDAVNITGWTDGSLTVQAATNGGGSGNGGSAVCKSVPLKVIFKGDSAKLTKKAKKALRGYAKKVVASGCTTVVLNGFTAKFTGAKQKAIRLELSKKRNTAVQKYLKKQFTALDFTAKFVKKSNGGKNPVVSNSDKNDRWKNRRVEIILRKVIFA